jgi:hypothetical protein
MTTTKATIKVTKQVLNTTVIIQIELGNVTHGSELETVAISLGYSLDGQNGDMRWYKSPLLRTAQEIDAARNPLKRFF